MFIENQGSIRYTIGNQNNNNCESKCETKIKGVIQISFVLIAE